MPNLSYGLFRSRDEWIDFALGILPQQEEGNFTMEKKYSWDTACNRTWYATESEATEKAKRWAGNRGNDSKAIVFQAVATVEAPMPEAIVTKL
jgi:hypothetical protein